MSSAAELPKVRDLVPHVMRAIESQGGLATNEEIAALIVRELGLSSEQVSEPHDKVVGKGRTELEYRIAWARTRLKSMGKIERRSRGVWGLTSG